MKEDQVGQARGILESAVARVQQALHIHKADVRLNASLILTLNNCCLAYK